jgi:hypothetical protein
MLAVLVELAQQPEELREVDKITRDVLQQIVGE